MKCEVRRHVVAELENLPGAISLPVADSGHEAAGPIEPSGDAEASLPVQGGAPWRLEKATRNMENLVQPLCENTSRVLSPFGKDPERKPLGTRLSGGEWFRRLLCLRFEIEYTSLPLGSKKLQAFTLEACERELASPE